MQMFSQLIYEKSTAEFVTVQWKNTKLSGVLFLTMICACPLGNVPVASALMGS